MKWILFLLPLTAFAGNYCPTVNNQTGTALGIATAQHQFDFGTYSWQGSVGIGAYDDAEAVSFAMGKRIDRMMFNGSVGIENGKTGVGAGLNWRF